MKYLRRFGEKLFEMAAITKKGKTVYADGKPLKGATIEDLDGNFGMYYEKNGNPMFSKGTFFLYMANDDEWMKGIQEGRYDLMFYPMPSRNIFSTEKPPITRVWGKKHQKDIRGSEMIIGLLEGWEDEKNDRIYLKMMSTNPKFKRNSVNTHLINKLKTYFDSPKTVIVWHNPTEQGLKFIHNYEGDKAHFYFNVNKPKNWEQLYPNHDESKIEYPKSKD